LLVLTNTTVFLLAPELNQVDTQSVVHLVAPNLQPAPANIVEKARQAAVPQLVTPATLEVRIPHVTPPLILPAKPPVEVAKSSPPALRTPLAGASAFPRPELVGVAVVPRALVSTRFGGNSVLATEGKSARQVETGGFGERDGALISAGNNGKGPMLARVGAFDLPNGPGSGNGTGGAKGVRSTATRASFGNAIDGQGEGRPASGQGSVRSANFGSGLALAAEAPKREVAAAASANETPVLLLSKPSLTYTPEARLMKIEGDVELDVEFYATGRVHVLRVVQGLGYGLDEAAVSAAEQIRFTPARRDGQSVDSHGLLRIIFRLS
jgi:TonB family protein